MRSRGKIALCLTWAAWLTLAGWGPGLAKDGEEIAKLGKILIEHLPVKEHTGEGEVLIFVRLRGKIPAYLTQMRLLYRVEEGAGNLQGRGAFQSVPLKFMGKSLWAFIPPQPRGTKVFYHLEARDRAGNRVTLPAQADAGQGYLLRFKGHAPIPLLLGHIGTMFSGALLFLLGAIFSVGYLRKGQRFERISQSVAWGTLLIFIGGFPLGMAMGYAVFGKPWTGLPIGGDVTDTKTLIVFIYWMVAVLLLKGTIFQGGRGKDWVNHKTFAGLTILGTILTALIYLIPHSI